MCVLETLDTLSYYYRCICSQYFSFFQVTYAFNVDSKGLVPADPVEGGSYRLSLVSNGTTTFNVDSYLNINEFADYQECSVHQYGCQGFGTACTVTYNPCCVQLGSTYYISFFNRGDDTATINAEAQVILASTMSNLGSLNNTKYEQRE